MNYQAGITNKNSKRVRHKDIIQFSHGQSFMTSLEHNLLPRPDTFTSAPASSQFDRPTSPPAKRRKVLSMRQQELNSIREFKQRNATLSALPARDREAIESCMPQAGDDEYWADIPLGMAEPRSDNEDPNDPNMLDTIKEYTFFTDSVHGAVRAAKFRKRRQTRCTRVADQLSQWEVQLDDLTAEFLKWRTKTSTHYGIYPPPPDPPVDGVDYFTVDAASLHWRNTAYQVNYVATQPFPNQTLIRHGLLASSPLTPTLAISLDTLETYRRLRLRAPRLSIQAFVRVLYDTHNQPYRRFLRQQMSDVFDIYLEIHRRVDTLVATALNQNAADWLQDEEPLEHHLLLSLDGNSSLKRFAGSGQADPRVFKSSYFLDQDIVEQYAGEVKERQPKVQGQTKRGKDKSKRKGSGKGKGKGSGKGKGKGTGKGKGKGKQAATTQEEVDEQAADVELDKTPKEPESEQRAQAPDDHLTQIEGVISSCAERWKANADDDKKGMSECFNETGIFVSVCRHGQVLVVCDMVCSGEKAKYPLAILARLQEVFPDAKLVGYDIGCSFAKTVQKSSIGKTLKARFVIPSMHGYAHNRACQLGHHPNYFKGSGLEDFEGCERLFSSSNDTARTTRYSTPFHRHQMIDGHLAQWDRDKYASLGIFLKNNYQQALDIIEEHSDLFVREGQMCRIKEGTFAQWLDEETRYLGGLAQEPEEDTLAVAYVEALDNLAKADTEYEAQRKINNRACQPPSTSATTQELGKRLVRKTDKALLEKLGLWQTNVADIESQLNLDDRWTPTSPEYIKAKEYMFQRKYRLALDNLEKLVVQRLFELQKGHLESTVKTAVKAYNTAASALSPPRAGITCKEVMEYIFLGEFDLLRDSRNDVRTKDWAKPANQILMDKYYRFVHAKEERVRLNIEIRRLRTWIRDQAGVYKEVIVGLRPSDPALAFEIQTRGRQLASVHWQILLSLDDIQQYKGYTGLYGYGVREKKLDGEIAKGTMDTTETAVSEVSSPMATAFSLDTEYSVEVESGSEDELDETFEEGIAVLSALEK